ncbi:MAG: tRNA (adenosine(37)-N6)-threonylcarbamoyltransferase complex dimerization subunit type 1 TsaB [Oscillatoriales cyanobacterium C42_A2020_001]|nr:tRNA (adenosine(37)-N6)-threonylcarbamoyltransferase complex dimerization subunit type 1 TsaB [Leptolyngbyaceae cyanobacterium C42_A2020_001]
MRGSIFPLFTLILTNVTNYGLAIHTASASLGLAINNLSGDARARVWALGRETSNLLHQYLIAFLQPQTWTDLAFIAVAKGPGGFTGTRIGVVTARTLAQQLELPLFAISTLAGVAWQTAKTLDQSIRQSTDIAVQMGAQRGEVFGAVYRISGADTGCDRLQIVLPDTVMSLEQWQHTLATWTTPYHRVEADRQIAASVADLLDLAWLDYQQNQRPHWSEVLPFYGQHPVEKGRRE